MLKNNKILTALATHIPSKERWHEPCQHTESSLHQLSPYIGKLKSSIASTLIEQYSKPGDLVVDPFAGSGTIPLQSALQGRRVFAADISPYARILTIGKLTAPRSLQLALKQAEKLLLLAKSQGEPDLRTVPSWVRKFYHPRTLKEVIRFTGVCIENNNNFMLSCLLGILHHQRPGFLSYPSSHLVPYLRERKFPRHKFAEMYAYRDIRSRLLAKITRVYKRTPVDGLKADYTFKQASINNLKLPDQFDCLITSPPYMNMLDYGRDNRLRLWFVDPHCIEKIDKSMFNRDGFIQGIGNLAIQINQALARDGYAILIVGERAKGSSKTDMAEVVYTVFKKNAPKLGLENIIEDRIPDIRRSRRDCKGTKTEHVIVFKKAAK